MVESIACGKGIKVILIQNSQLIAYYSEALKGSFLSLSIYEKEMLAIVKSHQKLMPLSLGKAFCGIDRSTEP